MRALPTHMLRYGYVEFHYATEFGITCLSRGHGGFYRPATSRKDVRFEDGPSSHSSSLRRVVKAKRPRAYLYRAPRTASGDDDESLFCPNARTFDGRNGDSRRRTGGFWWNWTSRRILAYSANCAPSDATKRNDIQNERDRFLVYEPRWAFAVCRSLKSSIEKKSKFSNGNLIREFV